MSARVKRAISMAALGWLLVTSLNSPVAAEQLPEPERVVIIVAGDVLLESSWDGPQDARHIFDGVREVFSQADLVFLNLEEPVTRARTVTPYKNRGAVEAGRDYVLRARDPAIPVILKESGVGLVGVANNHMMDYTAAGLRDTLGAFHGAGLPVVGAGLKPDAERAFLFKMRALRVALLAFTDVVPTHYEATDSRLGIASSKDETDLVNAIVRARRQADFVILMMHWGGQGRHLVTPRQRQLARIAARAGCDVVVGMHPHVLQGIEYFGRVPVFYSLGNFAFPSKNPAARESVVVKLTFSSGGLEGVNIVPAEISPQGAPQIVAGGRGEEILAHLDGLCHPFNAQVERGHLLHSTARQAMIYDTENALHRGDRSRDRQRRQGPLDARRGPAGRAAS